MTALMAQRTRRLPTEQEIPGSNPGKGYFFAFARERCVRERREKESAQAVRGDTGHRVHTENLFAYESLQSGFARCT
jgi:hypothetical protein